MVDVKGLIGLPLMKIPSFFRWVIWKWYSMSDRQLIL